jgi:hypothetical protein
MSTSIPLLPNVPFDLSRATRNISITRTLHIDSTGLFSVGFTGEARVNLQDDARAARAARAVAPTFGVAPVQLAVTTPVRRGGGGPGDGGGVVQVALSSLDWTLKDPDGKVFFSSDAGSQVAITADVLARYRDGAGFSSRAWSIQLTLPSEYLSATKVVCVGHIAPVAESNASAPPLVSLSGVAITGTRTFDFVVDRVGSVSTLASAADSSALDLQLLAPDGRVVATGKNVLTHAVGLVDLHAAQGKPWHLTVTTSPGHAATCTIVVEVLGTLRIPRSVLQPRVDAILGDSATAGSFTVGVDFDASSGGRNIVSLTVDENFYFTLDNFGFLDTIEAARLAWERTVRPDAVLVDLDPGVPYPIASFGGDYRIHNLRTGGISAVVGDPSSPSGGPPRPMARRPRSRPAWRQWRSRAAPSLSRSHSARRRWPGWRPR